VSIKVRKDGREGNAGNAKGAMSLIACRALWTDGLAIVETGQ
jgi:hypothetical protein